MARTNLQRDADARSRRRRGDLAEQLRSLMSDAGCGERELARAAGLASSTVCRALEGDLRPTLETYGRLAAVLGADVSVRLYPNTGPAIRDRLSAPMLEALLGTLDLRWHPFTEVAVRKPSRLDRRGTPRRTSENHRRHRTAVGTPPPGAAGPVARREGRLAAELGRLTAPRGGASDQPPPHRAPHEGHPRGRGRIRPAAPRHLPGSPGRRARRLDSADPGVARRRAPVGRCDRLTGATPQRSVRLARIRATLAPRPSHHRTGP